MSARAWKSSLIWSQAARVLHTENCWLLALLIDIFYLKHFFSMWYWLGGFKVMYETTKTPFKSSFLVFHVFILNICYCPSTLCELKIYLCKTCQGNSQGAVLFLCLTASFKCAPCPLPSILGCAICLLSLSTFFQELHKQSFSEVLKSVTPKPWNAHLP